MPICTGCKQDLPQSQFTLHVRSKTGYRARCKTCENLAKKDYLLRKAAGAVVKRETPEVKKVSSPDSGVVCTYCPLSLWDIGGQYTKTEFAMTANLDYWPPNSEWLIDGMHLKLNDVREFIDINTGIAYIIKGMALVEK